MMPERFCARKWLRFPKPYADAAARLRVPGGFALLVCFVWLSSPTPFWLALGLPASALGLGLRAWAAGHIAKDRQLTTSGPYAWVRNPLYLGSLIAAAGLAAAARSPLLALLFGVYFLFLYLPAIQLEEQHLRELFPEYDSYAARVPALIPRPRRSSGGTRFSWKLYRYNREHQALVGFLVAALLLVWKAWR